MPSTTLMPLATGILLVATQSLCVADTSTSHRTETHVNPNWAKLSVELPANTSAFPAGQGASVANSQCLICHSVEMVLSQPERTQVQWRETINKMRSAYGAPIPVDQTDPLSAYLARVVGRE